ncbi:MAG: 50S ribosomal protein L29 [Nitrososphaeria archaeon]|nr:50S ribosomal protein L29 [Conexivisphaerales archaeon]
MKKIKVSKLSDEELRKNLAETQKEILRLNNLRKIRMLGKESGSVKSVRRNIARILTELKRRQKKK